MAEGSDYEINPGRLFQTSYSLQGTASWLTEYQSELVKLDAFDLGLSRNQAMWTSGDFLRIQTVIVDAVTDLGGRQFGWADTKSALTTLLTWLYLSGCVTAVGTAGERGEQLDRGRLRQFAKTITGGACRRGGSYQESDDSALRPLEDWLRQSLMLRKTPTNLDKYEYKFANLVVPEDEWLKRLPAIRVSRSRTR